MDPREEVSDSPVGWVAAHARRYVKSDGTSGHKWYGKDTLLLTTRGRRTGRLRRTPLIYGRDEERYVVVASNGGKKKHPLWYLNLVENPEVGLQVGEDRFIARARPATPGEKPRLWKLMVEILPQYNSFQRQTIRDIPVVIFEALCR